MYFFLMDLISLMNLILILVCYYWDLYTFSLNYRPFLLKLDFTHYFFFFFYLIFFFFLFN